jgi:hypothetical protein
MAYVLAGTNTRDLSQYYKIECKTGTSSASSIGSPNRHSPLKWLEHSLDVQRRQTQCTTESHSTPTSPTMTIRQ